MKIKIKRFDTTLPLPSAEPRSVGIDLSCREEVRIGPSEIGLVPVNVAVEIPEGYLLLLAVRSSTPLKKGLILANGVGIVDPFYDGDQDEIKVQLLNITNAPVAIKKGELLTQAILIKHEAIVWDEVGSLGRKGHGGYWI